MKKIQDLGLLTKHHTGGWYSGMDHFIISWNDWLLEDIKENKLFLVAKPNIEGAGQRSEVHFKIRVYKDLDIETKEKVQKIFKDNIGKSVEFILNLSIN